jgi:hypothetical protein
MDRESLGQNLADIPVIFNEEDRIARENSPNNLMRSTTTVQRSETASVDNFANASRRARSTGSRAPSVPSRRYLSYPGMTWHPTRNPPSRRPTCSPARGSYSRGCPRPATRGARGVLSQVRWRGVCPACGRTSASGQARRIVPPLTCHQATAERSATKYLKSFGGVAEWPKAPDSQFPVLRDFKHGAQVAVTLAHGVFAPSAPPLCVHA